VEKTKKDRKKKVLSKENKAYALSVENFPLDEARNT
jgi:hypothetical protein